MHDDLDLNTLSHLRSVGYVVTDGPFNGISAPGSEIHRNGRPMTASSRSHDRLREMNGRLSNISYMAHAIDELDGVAHRGPEHGDAESGRAQLISMLDTDMPERRMTGLLYVALRRLQRIGNISGLRTGLVILLAHDRGEISGRDALSAVWPDALRRDGDEIAVLDARLAAIVVKNAVSSAA